jgi:hypothetical protein
LDANVRELTIIALPSLFSLGLAWVYEADFFAMFFGGGSSHGWCRGGSTISVTPAAVGCLPEAQWTTRMDTTGVG